MSLENVLIFQQATGPDYRRPWPVTVAPDGKILSGRPDAVQLVGFQRGDEQTVVVFAQALLAADDPAEIIGLRPVFVDKRGIVFAIGLDVESARRHEMDTAGLGQIGL